MPKLSFGDIAKKPFNKRFSAVCECVSFKKMDLFYNNIQYQRLKTILFHSFKNAKNKIGYNKILYSIVLIIRANVN